MGGGKKKIYIYILKKTAMISKNYLGRYTSRGTGGGNPEVKAFCTMGLTQLF